MPELLDVPQNDVEPELQAFQKWCVDDQNNLQGVKDRDNDQKARFIPQGQLEKYLCATERVERLLEALFKGEQMGISADKIRAHYLRAFAILIRIGRGTWIKLFIHYDGLRDKNLPFRDRPGEFPETSLAAEDDFARFQQVQWQFCAYVMEWEMSADLHPDRILPIVSKEPIGRGGSAYIYKIKINPENDSLYPKEWKQEYSRTENTFVLKTFLGERSQEYYEAERHAFSILSYGQVVNPSIVTCFGGFTRGQTQNLILEYADGGDLETYMTKTEFLLANGHDINMFWHRLSNVSLGLQAIHYNTIGSEGSASTSLLGWHHDITPSNILVFSGRSDSHCDRHFKLADLGLSHFESSVPRRVRATDQDRHGTRDYGAPESFRPTSASELVPVHVKQAADIWSLGCVFSEAAVWASQGSKFLYEYRKRRRSEIENATKQKGEYRFYNGFHTLEAVDEAHQLAKESRRIDDLVTRPILKHVVPYMLKIKPEERFTSQVVYTVLQDHLQRAQRPRASTASNTSHNDSQQRLSAEPNIPRMTPPMLPPDRQEPQGGDSTVFKPRYDPLQIDTESSKASVKSTFGDPYAEPVGAQIPLQKPSNPDADPGPSLLNPALLANDNYKRKRFPPRLGTGLQDGSTNQKSGIMDSRQHSPHAGISSPPGISAHSTQTRSPIDGPVRFPLAEALRWKKEFKKNRKFTVPGGESLTFLKERIHIFILDNSESMRLRIIRTAQVVEILSYIIKLSEAKSIEMYFTLSSDQVRDNRRTRTFVESIQKAEYRGVSKMSQSLINIIEPYRATFGEREERQPRFRFTHAANESHQTRPLSVYVLTDGNWHPSFNRIFPAIKLIVQAIKSKGLRDNHVGIQFINCGEPDEYQDAFLQAFEDGAGIVGITPHNADVWRMLLGAIHHEQEDYDQATAA